MIIDRLGSHKLKKCDFVVDGNRKFGVITKVKRQKSFDFPTVQFTTGKRGVPEDFLKKVPKTKVPKGALEILRETPVKGCKI